nr:putative ribonuclease H-like domain-containing protein [Tanacetum cinerariifolium]
MIDKALFIKRDKSDILLVQVYVDDIIFGSTRKEMCTEFETMMHKKFQMSSIGELTFFLGLQVKQKEDRIFISQDKYVNEILNKFGYSDVKTTSTPMETHKTLLKDEKGEDVDEHFDWIIDISNFFKACYYICTAKDGIEVNTGNSSVNAVGQYLMLLGITQCCQFWATTMAKNINGEVHIHAKVDGKNVIISEATIRRDHKFEYEVQAQEELGEDTKIPTDTQHPPTIIQPTTSQPQRKQKPRKTMRKDTELPQTSVPAEVVADKAVYKEMYNSVERDATTPIGLDAEQDRSIIRRACTSEIAKEFDTCT